MGISCKSMILLGALTVPVIYLFRYYLIKRLKTITLKKILSNKGFDYFINIF